MPKKEQIDFETAKIEPEVIPVESKPEITKPEWNTFVMTQFAEEELDDKGYPRVSGLRRVAELLLGEIVESEPFVITDVPGRCCVKHTIRIMPLDEMGNALRTFSDLAEATPENVNHKIIEKHLAATASTRAEARALRKALRLRVLSAEETMGIPQDTKTGDLMSGYIESGQIVFLETMCKRNNINVWAFINSKGFTNEGQVFFAEIEKIPYEIACKALRALTKIQNKTIVDVPQEVKGFDASWRTKKPEKSQ